MDKKCCHDHECTTVDHEHELAVGIEGFDSAAEFFRMLGDPTRIKLFWILCHREECGITLSERLGVSSPCLSHHLNVLRDCGLIDSRREGKEVYYRIADTDIGRTMHTAVESIMEVACPVSGAGATSSDTVRAVHDYLVEHLEERVTIDRLSRMFHINPTTLKEAFKAEYGMSLAAHIKEHRMEKAASLLRETQMSVSEVAGAVGFESHSQFTTAFKEKYGLLPSEYRKGTSS